MHALDYPGPPAATAGLLAADGGWTALTGGPPDRLLPELLAARVCVLGVGANAAPEVLHAKLATAGVRAQVPMLPVVVTGLAVAHSAHVSPGGYLPVTPYVAAAASCPAVACWLDPAALDALDRTEPNYVRTRLPASAVGAPPGAEAYFSRWGVLAPRGTPLPPAPQPAVHAVLAADPELARLLPLADPAGTVARLADPEMRDLVRERLSAAGWVRS